MAEVDVDVVVLGGGIAGLWTLARLRAAGLDAWLVETQALGEGQSVGSQGIIHGGLKYALLGKLTDDAAEMQDLPERWRGCLEGRGEVDLTGARKLSDHQLLWSSGSLASRVTTFFASRSVHGQCEALAAEAWPALFRQAPSFPGSVYRLDETVLDIATVLEALSAPHRDHLLHAEPGSLELTAGDDSQPATVRLQAPGGDATATLRAQALVLSAGAGNQALLEGLGLPGGPTMQRRPLHMVMARNAPSPLYAHCIGVSNLPRVTVTTHPSGDGSGEQVWWIGGALAEAGVERSEADQVSAARAELADLFPWADLSGLRFATLRIDRAELACPGGKKPSEPTTPRTGRVIAAWPTKLAFAPRLADQVLAELDALGVRRSGGSPSPSPIDDAPLATWPRPNVAEYYWDRPREWR